VLNKPAVCSASTLLDLDQTKETDPFVKDLEEALALDKPLVLALVPTKPAVMPCPIPIQSLEKDSTNSLPLVSMEDFTASTTLVANSVSTHLELVPITETDPSVPQQALPLLDLKPPVHQLLELQDPLQALPLQPQLPQQPKPLPHKLLPHKPLEPQLPQPHKPPEPQLPQLPKLLPHKPLQLLQPHKPPEPQLPLLHKPQLPKLLLHKPLQLPQPHKPAVLLLPNQLLPQLES